MSSDIFFWLEIMTTTRTILTPKYDTMVLIEIRLENSSFYLENGKELLPSLVVVAGVREGGKSHPTTTTKERGKSHW